MKKLKTFSLVIILHMAFIGLMALFTAPKPSAVNETARADSGDSRYSGLWQLSEPQAKRNATQAALPKERSSTRKEDLAAVAALESAPVVDLTTSKTNLACVYAEHNDAQEYTVTKGDSLWSISRKNGVAMRTLMQYNGIGENDRLRPGQVIMVPGKTNTGVQMASRDLPIENKRESNPLPEVRIRDAAPVVASVKTQPAAAPAQDGNARNYEVQPGDSLYIIALQNNTNVETIKRLNGLSNNLIRVGQQIRIPSGNESFSADSSKGFEMAFNEVPLPQRSAEQSVNLLQHEVQAGEVPGLIASKYNMTVSELLSLNGIQNPRQLQVGTQLKVKAPMPSTKSEPELQVASIQAPVEAASAKVEVEKPAPVSETQSPTANAAESSEDPAAALSSINVDDFPVVRLGS
jgi:LysM repeat protein